MPEIDANSFFESKNDDTLYHTWKEWKGAPEKFWECIRNAGSIESITLVLKNGAEYVTDTITPFPDESNWFNISNYRGDIHVDSVANMRITLQKEVAEETPTVPAEEFDCVLTISLREFVQGDSFNMEAFWAMMDSFTLGEGCFYQFVPRYMKEQIITREVERSVLKGHCKIAGKNYELMQISKILIRKGYIGEVSQEFANNFEKAVSTLSMSERNC